MRYCSIWSALPCAGLVPTGEMLVDSTTRPRKAVECQSALTQPAGTQINACPWPRMCSECCECSEYPFLASLQFRWWNVCSRWDLHTSLSSPSNLCSNSRRVPGALFKRRYGSDESSSAPRPAHRIKYSFRMPRPTLNFPGSGDKILVRDVYFIIQLFSAQSYR